MANTSRKSSALCGARSPWYVAPDLGPGKVSDLCTAKAGHRPPHRWAGYVAAHKKATA